MTLKEINKRIQKIDPCVELVRGEGYHYFVFVREATDDRPMVYESESVMIMYTSHIPATTWIADGIAFGAKTRDGADA